MLETIWTTEKLLANTVIKELISSLNESEAHTFIGTIKAVCPSPELTYICNVITRLHEIIKIIEVINWPDEMKEANTSLLLALEKVSNSEYFKKVRKKEIYRAQNPLYGRIDEYPIISLFCQNFGNDFQDIQKPLIYLLHYMLLQISQHNKWDATKKLILLTNAANTIRKIVACKKSLNVSLSLGNLTYNKLTDLLLVLSNDGHIDFQEQFLRAWSEFYDNKIFIRNVKRATAGQKTAKQKPKSKIQKGTVSSIENSKKHKNYVTTRNGTKIKEKHIRNIVEDTKYGDETEIINLLEVITPDNIELDYRTKNAAGIYGSRLNLIEKMHLPWRTTLLADHEVSAVVSYLHDKLKKAEPEAIFLSLVLLTSKPFDELTQINTYSQTPNLSKVQEDFIDLQLGTWNRRSIEMPDAFIPTIEQKKLLASHSKWLALPIPDVLINAIKHQRLKHENKCVINIGDICFVKNANRSSVLSSFLVPLWKNSTVVNRRITAAAIRATAFEKITHEFDGGYAALMLANTEFDTSTTLYYLAAKAEKLISDYVQMISSLGFLVNSRHIHDVKSVVGSYLTIDKEKIAQEFTKKRTLLKERLTQNKLSIRQLIERHNEYVNYTLITLIAATGHRSRTEFCFTSSTYDKDNSLNLVSDKIHFVDSAIRLIPECKTTKNQLLAYKNHCAELARVIKSHNIEVATQLAKAATLNLNDEPDLFHITPNADLTKIETRSVGYRVLEQYLAPEINLPLNFLRHYFCSALRELGEYKNAKSLLGHVGNGEHILSNHSLATLHDLSAVSKHIDSLLKTIGLEAIEYSPLKGPTFHLASQEVQLPYKPFYLIQPKITEKSEQIRWIRKLISPNIQALRNKNTHEQTSDMLVQEIISDNECGITLERRLALLNRFISKVAKSSLWFTKQDETSLLCLEPNSLLDMRQAIQIKSEINHWLLTSKNTMTAKEQIARIWCSLIVNSKMNIPTNIKNLQTITSPPFYENGLAWFEFKMIDNSHRNFKVVHIDSISLLLIQKYDISDVEIKSAKGVKNSIYTRALHKISKQYNFDAQARKALENIDSTGEYLRNSRSFSASALTHAYQNDRIKTTNLTSETLCRWLSPTPLRFNPTLSISTDFSCHGLVQFSHDQNKKSSQNYQKSRLLLQVLQTNLYQLKQQGVGHANATKVVLETWGDFIGMTGEASISKLIESSQNLDQIIILLLLWLIDVSKRPGRGKGRRTAIGTLKTYISNVAKPLIEQAIGSVFLSLSSEELSELYRDALASRNIMDITQRAENMRNFHNFVKKTYHCSPVDWFDVEPSIGNNDSDADANIISMREYNSTLELLKNDECSNPYQRRVNQLILILCYRAGLRSGETAHLRFKDIDTINWIIYIRSSYFYRTKTVQSNRRIPIGYFLSDEEKSFILEQFSYIKAFHPEAENPWFFSDETTAKCLIPINKQISRIIEALRISTGDDNIRLHHARHSFANYMLMLMSKSTYSSAMYIELQSWCRTVNISEFSQQVIIQFVGKKKAKENILNTISLALGHVSPQTTLCSYIHIMDLMSAAENEILLINTINKSSLTSIVSIERTNIYKILSRSNDTQQGFLPLCSYVAKTWKKYQQLVNSRKDITKNTLTPISVPSEKTIYNQMNNIERVIRMAEYGLVTTKIANELQLEFIFVLSVIKATRAVKLATGYTGTSISSDLADVIFDSSNKKQHTAAKYIQHENFQNLLIKLAELNEQQRIELCGFFNKNYNPRHGIVIDSTSKKKFTDILSLIDCEVIDTEQSIILRDQYSRRKGHIVKITRKSNKTKINTENKIIHAIFLLNIWNIAKQER